MYHNGAFLGQFGCPLSNTILNLFLNVMHVDGLFQVKATPKVLSCDAILTFLKAHYMTITLQIFTNGV